MNFTQIATILEAAKADVVYHCSPDKHSILTPQNLHGDPGRKQDVFASPYKEMAYAYLGKKWGDRDMNQSGYIKNGKYHWVLEEMRPNVFEELYKGRTGYLYVLPAATFKSGQTRGGTSEVVSQVPVKPLNVVKIENVLGFLKSKHPIIEMKKYNPNGAGYKAAVERMKKRLARFGNPKERQKYLDWVGETNPKLKQELEGSVSERYKDSDLVPHSAIAALIQSESGEVLILDHVKIKKWTIPVGKVDEGKTPEQATKQEVREELGLVVSELKLIEKKVKTYTRGRPGEPQKKIPITLYIYKVLKYAGIPSNKEPNKHRSMKWASLQELKELMAQGLLSDATQWALQELIKV